MAQKFIYKGIPAEVETVDQLVEALRKLGDAKVSISSKASTAPTADDTADPENAPPSDWDEPSRGTWEAVVYQLCQPGCESQKAMLTAIKSAGTDGITRHELVSQLGVASPNAIGGINRGLGYLLDRAGVPKSEVVTSEGSSYFAGALLSTNDVPD